VLNTPTNIPEQHHQSLRESLKVIVAMYRGVVVERNLPKHLQNTHICTGWPPKSKPLLNNQLNRIKTYP